MSNFPAPVLNIFSQMTNWLFAEPAEGAQKRPTLRFGVFGNEPRITVKTNVPNDLNHGKIDFNCDMATFFAAMSFAKALAEGTATATERKFVYQNDFVAGKKLDRIIPITTLVIGRAQDGRMYIALLSAQASRPKIRFFFGPTKYHNITNGDGSAISAEEMSNAYALGYLQPATQFMFGLLTGVSFDPNAKGVANPANIGGGQGGGQRPQGGGGGGYQQRPQNNGGGGGGGFNKPASGGFDDFDSVPDFG
ncbi:hypothetical protein PHABIO_103 [Pseudomonas phage Phabio]|uniref:Uncharacterized protein n=1 Tax=Pseudomonas phage Phabio TaxID=2006668 RepID=A0A1Y0SVZ5_9CAUD|nr:hypothetical protein MZD05_gp103 [Pseudomonas phage Phabio]ARV76734.1 hypothetical protein PHABIO_103 [Pseudomonas phage Phabio]